MPGKHPALVVWSESPLNVETPLALLCGSATTPNELFYVRNHGGVPDVDPGSFRLAVGGAVDRPLSLSLDDLRDRFSSATVAAALACAGNRRGQLEQCAPIPGQTPWGAGAIGSALWRGARLRDLLLATGVQPEAAHVAFTGLDDALDDGRVVGFGGSIPLRKALSPDVILAYEMNGEPLPRVHGFPLRVVVPGFIGARSVKWLSTITVQAEPSSNVFQRDYEIAGQTLGELSINSAICGPSEGETVAGARLPAHGYAIAGGGRGVERVEVSLDGGRSWFAAELDEQPEPWTWRLWRAELHAPSGPGEIVVRAWDSAGQTQPDDPATIWNAKGYMNNAWHRVGLRLL